MYIIHCCYVFITLLLLKVDNHCSVVLCCVVLCCVVLCCAVLSWCSSESSACTYHVVEMTYYHMSCVLFLFHSSWLIPGSPLSIIVCWTCLPNSQMCCHDRNWCGFESYKIIFSFLSKIMFLIVCLSLSVCLSVCLSVYVCAIQALTPMYA